MKLKWKESRWLKKYIYSSFSWYELLLLQYSLEQWDIVMWECHSVFLKDHEWYHIDWSWESIDWVFPHRFWEWNWYYIFWDFTIHSDLPELEIDIYELLKYIRRDLKEEKNLSMIEKLNEIEVKYVRWQLTYIK